MSGMEEALSQATSSQLSKGQDHHCWGCDGLDHYAATPFHLYGEFPHQDDPEVQVRAQQKIDEYVQWWVRGGHLENGHFRKKEVQGKVTAPQDMSCEKRQGGMCLMEG